MQAFYNPSEYALLMPLHISQAPAGQNKNQF
jgi:hypothetical protein